MTNSYEDLGNLVCFWGGRGVLTWERPNRPLFWVLRVSNALDVCAFRCSVTKVEVVWIVASRVSLMREPCGSDHFSFERWILQDRLGVGESPQVAMAWQQQGPGFDQYGAQPGMQAGMQPGMPQAPVGPNNPLNDVFYGAGSGLLGTYLGNSKDYVQSNVSSVLLISSSRLLSCFFHFGFQISSLCWHSDMWFNRSAGIWQLTTFSIIFKSPINT